MIVDIYLSVPSRDDRLALDSGLRELPISVVVESVVSVAAAVTSFEQLRKLVALISLESPFDTKLRDCVLKSHRDALRSFVRRISALIPDEVEARSLRPVLARILGSLGDPEDVALVATWVEAEQARWDAQYDALSRAQTVADRHRIGQLGISWWQWYREALALFQCASAERILVGWLTSPHLISDGAAGLVNYSIIERSSPYLQNSVAIAAPCPQRHPSQWIRASVCVPMRSSRPWSDWTRHTRLIYMLAVRLPKPR